MNKRLSWFLLAAVGCLLFLGGLTLGTSSHSGDPPIARELERPAPPAPPPKLEGTTPKTLRLTFAPKAWQALVDARAKALEQSLHVNDGSWVDASLDYEGVTLPIQARLKGDWIDHIKRDKSWSLRIKIRRTKEEKQLGKPEGQVLGLRRFSVQHPSTRSDQVEALFMEHMRMEQILAPRYDFVRVVVNDADWGLMALEEHFAKELVEHQQRKEGVIGRLDESDMWRFRAEYYEDYVGPPAPYSPFVSSYKAFRRKRTASVPELDHQRSIAAGLMAGLQEGRLRGADVFDLDKVARFLVLCELWGGHHAHIWHNLRFYLDPFTLRLEPVAYDNGMPLLPMSGQQRADLGVFWTGLLNEPELRAAIGRQLGPVLARVSDGDVLKVLAKSLERIDRLYVGADLGAPKLDLGVLAQNARGLAKWGLDYFYLDSERALHKHVTPHLYADGALIILNALPVPVQVEKIVVSELLEDGTKRERKTLAVDRTIAATPLNGAPSTLRVQVPAAAIEGAVQLEVFTHRAFESESRTAVVSEKLPFFSAHPLTDAHAVEAITKKHGWLAVDQARTRLVAKRGHYKLDEPLRLPPGWGLELQAGVQITFGPSAYVQVNGPLDVLGTEEEEVRLLPSGKDWKGIFVDRPGGLSTWQHARIERTTALVDDNLTLTGAVSFREADIRLTAVVFDGTSAEDALNLVHTRYVMDNVTVRNTSSDGIDTDFCTGELKDSHFSNIGGDAFDVSGSEANAHGLEITNVGDKGVSVGEGSRVTIRDVKVVGARIGVASKDRSEARVESSSIQGARLAALTAYVKKPEYGGATLVAERVDIQGSEPVLVQSGSQISVDGRPVPAARPDEPRLQELK